MGHVISPIPRCISPKPSLINFLSLIMHGELFMIVWISKRGQIRMIRTAFLFSILGNFCVHCRVASYFGRQIRIGTAFLFSILGNFCVHAGPGSSVWPCSHASRFYLLFVFTIIYTKRKTGIELQHPYIIVNANGRGLGSIKTSSSMSHNSLKI